MITVRIPYGLSGSLCLKREQRFRYSTNRAFKSYGLWLLLKTVTTSGHIQNYQEQLPDLMVLTRLSRSTFYRHLNWCVELGLVKKGPQDLRLTSFERVSAELLLEGGAIDLQYDADSGPSIDQLLKALEYSEARAKMALGLKATIRRTPAVVRAFKLMAMYQGKPELEFTRENLFAMQKQAFCHGGAEDVYEMLFEANPDLNRKLETIAFWRNMKCISTAHYERRQLEKSGLIHATSREPIQCKYSCIPDSSKVKGRLRERRRAWSQRTQSAIWYLPVSLELNLPTAAQA
jgi:hypothetical protein